MSLVGFYGCAQAAQLGLGFLKLHIDGFEFLDQFTGCGFHRDEAHVGMLY